MQLVIAPVKEISVFYDDLNHSNGVFGLIDILCLRGSSTNSVIVSLYLITT
eukprot:SAG22_NODE_4_length_44774_cov_362.122149_45_plen_51_part_00